MLPLKKKISATFCLPPSWVTTRLPVWCEPMRVWMTVARSKNFRLPWSCLRRPRGTFRVVASSRRASTRQRLRAKAGRRRHEVEEDGLLEREQLRVLGRAHGRRPRRAGEQRQLAQHLARARGRRRASAPRRPSGAARISRTPALHDVEAVALLALAEDHRPGAELLEAPLGQDRLQHLVRLVLEEVGGAQERGVDGGGHGSAIIQCVKMAAVGARNPPARRRCRYHKSLH